jgi:DNA (cytosine-5)-methyltransferase 1
MKRLTVADFFCGAGGFSEGFRMKGFDVVFALDNWKPAITTHKLNHPECNSVQADILELDTPKKIDALVPNTDVIIGSPPCVSFSGSNKAGKADKTLGIKLIEAYLRIVLWKKSKGVAKYWILENVPNSDKYIKDEYTWKELGLPGNGPSLKIKTRAILNAAEYDVPQGRKRLFLGDFPLPGKTNMKDFVKLGDVLKTLTKPSSFKEGTTIADPNYPDLKLKSEDVTDHFYDTTVAEFEWKSAERLKRDHGFMGKMSFPEDTERPSRTVMATRSASTREAMILGDERNGRKTYRMPTIREVASIMSFPVTYQFEGGSEEAKYKQVGNAVCPKLISAIAGAIEKDAGMDAPAGYLFDGTVPKLTMNLNGTKRKLKKLGPKPLKSKFSDHVPYLKANGFRVELTNRNSDFERQKFLWDCVLHHGSGKSAKMSMPSLKDVEKILHSWGGLAGDVERRKFEEFQKSISAIKSRVPNPETYQKINCNIIFDKGMFGPMNTLEKIKKAVDENYPHQKFDGVMLDNSKDSLKIGRDRVPLRIAMAFFACKSAIVK